MAQSVIERIREREQYFRDNAEAADAAGRIPDATAQKIRETEIVKMLQPKQYGGLETHPVEYVEATIELGSYHGSAGWVGGVVGIHPPSVALFDRQCQDDVWGVDGAEADNWIASPYAPLGRARRVEGGYLFNGRWPFSSGTDNCQWIILGGIIVDSDGKPDGPDAFGTFVLPRADYDIDQDSWNVVGLRGSGSKDVTVTDKFVPEYRTLHGRRSSRERMAEVGYDSPIWAIPGLFNSAITAGALGIAKGALNCFIEWTRGRVNSRGVKSAQDPYQLEVLARAAADIDASIKQVIYDLGNIYDFVAAGGDPDVNYRLDIRRNQSSAARRAIEAVDQLMLQAGGHALHLDFPLQRFWRDAHAAAVHRINTTEPFLQAWGLNLFGGESQIPPGVLY